MALQDSRDEYARRMHQVQAYIDAHLDEPLELADLAQVAHFSAFHFHRLFAAWMGETLGDYLRRRRLEIAAVRLIGQPDDPVLNIALGVGFGSAEAFARAFKSRFGVTATEWRAQHAQQRAGRLAANSNPSQAHGNPDQDLSRSTVQHEAFHQPLESNMQVTIVERPLVHVAYMRHIGPYGAPIGDFWQHTFAPWMMTHHLMGEIRYGISHDDPVVTAPEKCRYDACVEVDKDYVAQPPAALATIPGGRFACTRYYGPSAGIGAAWHEFYGQALGEQGLGDRPGACFERYAADFRTDPDTGAFECELFIPIE